VTGSIQFDVSDRTRLTLDSLYAKLDQTRNEEFLEIISPAREAGSRVSAPWIWCAASSTTTPR
jgi:hypothetical protein